MFTIVAQYFIPDRHRLAVINSTVWHTGQITPQSSKSHRTTSRTHEGLFPHTVTYLHCVPLETTLEARSHATHGPLVSLHNRMVTHLHRYGVHLQVPTVGTGRGRYMSKEACFFRFPGRKKGEAVLIQHAGGIDARAECCLQRATGSASRG